MIKVGKYYRPKTIEEALKILGNNENKTKILAGGTDLVLELKDTKEKVDIVDIGELQQLKDIAVIDEKIIIGSLVTFSQIQNSEIIRKYYNALAEAAAVVGAPQIRNQGTIVGNIANASPAADSVPSLVAIDAEVLVASKRGKRRVKVVELLKGINKTDLAPDELILEVSFKKIPGLKSGFAKLGRRNALAISRISAAVGIITDDKKIVKEARVALGSVAPNPFRSKSIENALIGKHVTDEIEDVLSTASNVVAEKLGMRSSAPYKREAVRGVLRQALKSAFSDKDFESGV